jgi:hypothetical protein
MFLCCTACSWWVWCLQCGVADLVQESSPTVFHSVGCVSLCHVLRVRVEYGSVVWRILQQRCHLHCVLLDILCGTCENVASGDALWNLICGGANDV